MKRIFLIAMILFSCNKEREFKHNQPMVYHIIERNDNPNGENPLWIIVKKEQISIDNANLGEHSKKGLLTKGKIIINKGITKDTYELVK